MIMELGFILIKKKAFDLYRVAAEKGNIEAQKSLGLLYE